MAATCFDTSPVGREGELNPFRYRWHSGAGAVGALAKTPR